MTRVSIHTLSLRNILLASAALVVLAAPAFAADAVNVQSTSTASANNSALEAATNTATANAAPEQGTIAQALKSIRGWFGADVPQSVDTMTGDVTAAADDSLQVPPSPNGDNPALIEPAAGFDDDMLQAPPEYIPPQSSNTGTPRATSFDGAPSVAAFGDQQQPAGSITADTSAGAIADIAPAAGESTEHNPAEMNCKAVLNAEQTAPEGEKPGQDLVTACQSPVEGAPAQENADAHATPTAPGMMPAPAIEPAQPAFEPAQPAMPLPATQPAAGDATVPETETQPAARETAPVAQPAPATAPAQN